MKAILRKALADLRRRKVQTAVVMLVVLLAMNSFAIWLRNRYEQRW